MRTIVVAALLLCACSTLQSGADNVSLAVDPASAAPGDSITLTLTNGTSTQIGYNLCTTGLERQQGSGWEAVPSDRVCTMELRTLEPGQQTSYRSTLPDPLPPGDYRAFTTVEMMGAGDRVTVRTDTFRVTP